MSERYVVTSALPYANGDIHLGHLVEHIQTDIYVRALRLEGHHVAHICADDTHGTPIQLRAEAEGVSPEDFVARWHSRHVEDFARFSIGFDYYGSTHTDDNAEIAAEIYGALKDKSHISTRDVEQMFCASCTRFLPDRFVRGTCPKCGASEQYGDVCESCSSTYDPEDLKDPHCSICGATPEIRSSRHYFVDLAAFADSLRTWTREPGHLQNDVRNYVDRWLEEGLRDWDISRDGPYFGFKIPGEDNKYFYVWLDAPVGYISNTRRWCREQGLQLDDYWKSSDTKVVHFIGKDIIYFHTLFWPAMLMASGYNLPDKVHVHGMLTANGHKLSKSRGTFINARTYLEYLDPQAYRYYLAAKLSAGIEDIDLNLEDFVARVNADLSNRIVNLLSRSLQFANKRLGSQLGQIPDDAKPLCAQILQRATQVRQHYANLEFSRAIKLINECADIGNKYLQDEKPFQVVKTNEARARDVTTFAINAGKIVMTLLKPVLPDMVARVEKLLGDVELSFDKLAFDLVDHRIANFERLFERVESTHVEAMVTATAAEAATAAGPALNLEPEISYEQLMTVDLRAGRIVKAEQVPKAKKLLRLEVDIGEGSPRQIFAGLRQSYAPEDLQGKMVAVVANLASRKMRFGVSEGMVLAGGEDDSHIHVVEVPGAQPGERIR